MVSADPYHQLRQRMVREQLAARGIADPRVLEAMGRVPRHEFVPPAALARAYADNPLPIGKGQTISQPYMVAKMTEVLAVEPHHRVLDVGAGSGYQSAVLAELCRVVYGVERILPLAKAAGERLHGLGYHNVHLKVGDGTEGWVEQAPFDRILVAAAAPDLPPPLIEQLADGGRLAIPVGRRHFQELQVVIKRGEEIEILSDVACRFVSLIGEYGWDA